MGSYTVEFDTSPALNTCASKICALFTHVAPDEQRVEEAASNRGSQYDTESTRFPETGKVDLADRRLTRRESEVICPLQ